jgi:hypothetical protein
MVGALTLAWLAKWAGAPYWLAFIVIPFLFGMLYERYKR